MVYSAYFLTNGTIEFKYRKDSKKTGGLNGEFKFVVNGLKVVVDHDYQSNDWKVYSYQVPKSPGSYNFEWIYTKQNTAGVTDSMSAEIEYIRVDGL